MAAVDVLELLLTARYVGTPAFRALEGDLAGLEGATNGLQKLGAAMSAVGTIMIAGGLAMAAGVGFATKAASDYDSAIQRIVAVTPLLQTHRDALAQLNNEIATAAANWGISPTEIAQGSYMLMSSAGVFGAGGAKMLLDANIINELAMFSRASGYPQEGGVSYSDAANQLPRIFAAAGLKPQDWGAAMGVMTYLENQAHMNQSQMTNAMNAYLPAMAALGEPFPDAATLIAAIASSGRVGAPAGREALSAITLMLGGASQQAELHKLGLSTGQFFGKNGALLPTDQIMAMLQMAIYSHAKSPADVLSIEHSLFGQVGLRALGPFLSQAGFAKYQNLLAGEKSMGITTAAGANDYLRAVSERQMQAPSAQFDALKAALELLAITIGNDVLPTILRLVHALTDLALEATKFAAAHPELTKAAAIGGPLGLIGGGIGMKGLGSLVSFMGGSSGAAGLTRGADLLGNHIGPLLGGLFAGGMALPGKLFSGITDGIQAIMDMAPQAAIVLEFLFQHPLAPLRALGGGIKTLISTGFDALLSAIGDVVVGFIPFLAGLAEVAFPILLVAGAIATVVLLFTAFRAQGEQIVNFLGSIFGPMFQVIAGAVGSAVQSIKAAWNSAYPAISSAMDALVSGIKQAAPLFQLLAIVVGAAVVIVIAALQALAVAFLSVLGPVIRIFGDIFQVIGGVLNLIVGIVTLDGNKISQAFGQIFGGLLDIVKNAFTAIAGLFANFVGSFLGFIGQMINAVTGGALQGAANKFVSIWQGASNAVEQIFPADGNSPLLKGVKAEADKIIASQQSTYQKMNSDAATEAQKFYVAGEDIAQALTDGAYARMVADADSMSEAAHKWGKAIIGATNAQLNISSPSKVFYHIGQMVGLGFQQGILAGQSGVINAAVTVAQSAVYAAHHVLKIRSPSQVFHEMGVMTMKGYQEGVASHKMDWSHLMPDHIGALHVGAIHTGPSDNNGPYRFALAVQGRRESVMHRYNQDRDALSYVYRLGYEYTG